MRTLDSKERKWGFGAAGLVVAIALLGTIPYNTTDKYPKGSAQCPPPPTYHVVGKNCVGTIHHTTSVWQVAVLAILAVILLYVVWSSRRTLTIFVSLFSGLAARNTLGLLVIFYGAWLLLRSWRLQRYGVTDGKAVRQIATERSAARKVARRTPATTQATSKTPTPSKRYTPKAKPRKK
ncbi:MAG TPA: hypothetical protein VIE15_02975 [Acidimicrobiales bacterium]